VSNTQIIVFSILQGITEFFPVSSSAHLILLNRFLGWADSGLALDVAVHLGTLGSLIVYFWKETLELFEGGFDLVRGRLTSQARFFLLLGSATLPLVFVGFLIDSWAGATFRTTEAIAWSTLVFGLLLYGADRFSKQYHNLSDITPKEAFWAFGMAQCFAVIHGVSRSGICLTAGRFLGYKRLDATRFSLLMAIPAIGAAGVLKGAQLFWNQDYALIKVAALGMGVSFFTGLGAISLLMLWLKRFSLTFFALYRIILGILLLINICF
jgi:undecaprenyl-diphosphatase